MSQLPNTGSEVVVLIIFALILIAAGVAVWYGTRKRDNVDWEEAEALYRDSQPRQ